MYNELLAYVRLSTMPGFGVLSQRKILKLCGSINNCFGMSKEEIIYKDNLSAKEYRIGANRLELFASYRENRQVSEKALRIIEECHEKRITIITSDDIRYPKRFCMLPDMPIVVYVKGDLRINEFTRSVGIVGARRCSREGKQRTVMQTEEEVRSGAAIISGMAKGIDSYAHTAAIINNGYTVAVLGNSPDICYPKEHSKLYFEIIEHGCILSEYSPGTEPRGYMFPKRNRLIAALSDIVYVIDAKQYSGTETTVKEGIRYGRKIVKEAIAEKEPK